MSTELNSNWKRAGLITLMALVVAVAIPQVSSADIFGMAEDYPGGQLKAVFSMEDPESDAPTRTYTVTVKPDGEGYDVTETVKSPERAADDVSTGFGPSGGAGAGGGSYEEDSGANLDLSPLTVLDDRNVKVKPDTSYLLTDGARLVTKGEKTIAGIEVVIGIFTHPNYTDQRATLAFTRDDTDDLLLWPPLYEIEEGGEVQKRIELVEFDYQE